MNRLIDADVLFEKVGNVKPKNKSEYELLGKFMNMITDSNTVETPQWILCSERLPEDPDTKRIYVSKTYQVTTVDGRTIVLLWHKTEVRGKMVMRWEYHNGTIYRGDVLAWKPLSEPYKREGEKE